MTVELSPGEEKQLNIGLMPIVQWARLYSAPSYGGNSIDCAPTRSHTSSTWLQIHDGVQTSCEYNQSVLRNTIACSSASWRYNHLFRVKITFPLSAIPLGSTIISASYHARVERKYLMSAPSCSYALFEYFGTSYNGCPSSDYQDFGTIPISNIIPASAFVAGSWCVWDILPAYFKLIPPQGKAMFGLREATYDAPDIPCPWGYLKTNSVYWYSVEHSEISNHPYLEITCQPP